MLQSRRVFSDSSLTFLIIIFKSSLNELNIKIMMIVGTMIIIWFIIFYSPKLDISCHVLFQMLIKRKNSDSHVMDVSIFMKLMIHHPKSEFDFFKNMKITSVRRNVCEKKFSSSSFQQVLLLYLLNWYYLKIVHYPRFHLMHLLIYFANPSKVSINVLLYKNNKKKNGKSV